MQRVERHIVIGDIHLDDLCWKSKNLYNYVNYLIRQEFTKNGKMLSEYEVDSYMGKRIKRGLFRSSTGKVLNADLNGAIGILRKVSHKRYMQVVSRGEVETPSRLCVIL